jgi:hypothetical protein
MGFIESPFVDISSVHPLPNDRSQKTTDTLRYEGATLHTRSVLVVPPDFNGLRRTLPCEFVAPRSRPWGSPSFTQPAAYAARCDPLERGPYEAFPSLVASAHHQGCPVARITPVARTTCHCASYPPAVDCRLRSSCVATARLPSTLSTSGSCSTKESVAGYRCCHQ